MKAYTSSSSSRAMLVALDAAGSSTTSAWVCSAGSSSVTDDPLQKKVAAAWGRGRRRGLAAAGHRANRDRRDSEPCLGHYRSRLRERAGISARPAPGWWLCAPGQRHATPAQEQEPQHHEDEERTDRPEACDDVVDRGDEIVCGVVERGGEAPTVGRRRASWRSRFRHGDADRAEGSVVVEVLDLTFELLDLGGDLADLVLDRDDVVDVLRLGQQGQHRVALSFGVGQTRAEVDVLRTDVSAGDVLALHLPHLGQLIDRGVEMGGRDHEVDDARPDLAVLRLVRGARLGIGAGDVAALQLDEVADLCELGIKGA